MQSKIDGTKSANKFFPLKLSSKEENNYVRFSFKTNPGHDTCLLFEHFHGTRASSNLTMTLEETKKDIVFKAPVLKANSRPKSVLESICLSKYSIQPDIIRDISFRFYDNDTPLDDMGDLWLEMIAISTDKPVPKFMN